MLQGSGPVNHGTDQVASPGVLQMELAWNQEHRTEWNVGRFAPLPVRPKSFRPLEIRPSHFDPN